MTSEYAERLKTDWKLRINGDLVCSHQVYERQGENGSATDIYICVRCGHPLTVKPDD